MLTRFAKILTVIIAFASIGLMGAAITITNAGPNWRTEAEKLPDYTFTQDAATKMWSVSHRTDSGTNLVSNVPHPGAIAAAYRHVASQKKEELDLVEPQIEPLQTQIAEIKSFREIDERGLKSRNEQLKKDFAVVAAEVRKIGQEADAVAQAALRTRTIAAARREDGQRLLLQLEGIETDHFHLKAQRKKLLDTLYQIQGLQIRLRQRNTQLKATGVPYDPVSATTSAETGGNAAGGE